jgi:hypothetical protein
MKKAKERPDGTDRWTSNGYGLTFGEGWQKPQTPPKKAEKGESNAKGNKRR